MIVRPRKKHSSLLLYSFTPENAFISTPLLLHSLILMRSYYIYFWQSEIMQSSAKFCKVRRISALIMSEKKVFPFISGTRCRYQHKSLPKTCAERYACKGRVRGLVNRTAVDILSCTEKVKFPFFLLARQ